MPHPPQIPLTPQTDERNFPRHDSRAPPGHSGHPYPKMLTRAFTREDREVWLQRNVRIDITSRQQYYEERVPKIGDPIPVVATQDLVDAGLAQLVGEPVVVNDAEDEQLVYETLGIEKAPARAGIITVPLAGSREVELAAENERLKKMLEEKPKRRGGRPKGSKNRPVPAAVEDPDPVE